MKRAAGIRKAVKIIGLVFLLMVVTVLGYLAYVMISYERIPDGQVLAVSEATQGTVSSGQVLTAVTYNIGYGSYPPEYSFFMDGGTESRAASKESVLSCINGAMELISAANPDVMLLQEVDEDADRSYHTDQTELIRNRFSDYSSVFAVNYNSAYLFYPLTKPIGKSLSGVMTLACSGIDSAVRRSLPISESFSKLLDLDRCYSISALPVDNGKTLYIYNVHLTAFGGTADISTAQITMLAEDMSEKSAGGNYVLCGGDFNHDLPGDSVTMFNPGQDRLGWCQPFPTELLLDGFTLCMSDNPEPTCRNSDQPYDPETNFFAIVDGFIISDNIEAVSLKVLAGGYTYSDHNPVKLEFRLK